jgi:transcriptional regulator with XRE-family HTH domain
VKKAADVQLVLRELGQRLRSAREAAGLTQEEAAHKAGIDYKRWQRLEQGTVNPTIRTLIRVADALGIGFWGLTRRP